MDIDPEKIYLRPPKFYDDIKVDIQTKKEAVSLDIQSQHVAFSDGDRIKYDKLLIATGNMIIYTSHTVIFHLVGGYNFSQF